MEETSHKYWKANSHCLNQILINDFTCWGLRIMLPYLRLIGVECNKRKMSLIELRSDNGWDGGMINGASVFTIRQRQRFNKTFLSCYNNDRQNKFQ